MKGRINWFQKLQTNGNFHEIQGKYFSMIVMYWYENQIYLHLIALLYTYFKWHLWKCKTSLDISPVGYPSTKSLFYKTLIVPMLLYTSETWVLTVTVKVHLEHLRGGTSKLEKKKQWRALYLVAWHDHNSKYKIGRCR